MNGVMGVATSAVLIMKALAIAARRELLDGEEMVGILPLWSVDVVSPQLKIKSLIVFETRRRKHKFITLSSKHSVRHNITLFRAACAQHKAR
jgi:hypothetical protein